MHAYDARHGAQGACNSPTLNQDAIARSQLDELLVCVLRRPVVQRSGSEARPVIRRCRRSCLVRMCMATSSSSCCMVTSSNPREAAAPAAISAARESTSSVCH